MRELRDLHLPQRTYSDCGTHIILLVVLSLGFSATSPASAADPVEAAADRLIAAARIYDQPEMNAAREAMVAIGVSAVPALRNAIDDFDDNVRWQAIVALGQIGPAARPAFQQVHSALADDFDPDVRAAAAETLALLDDSSNVTYDAVENARRDEHPLVQAAACWASWHLRQNNDPIDHLGRLLGERDWLVVQRAVRHLAQIGSPAVGRLAELLKDVKASGRPHAAEALERMGAEAAGATDTLIKCLGDDDPLVTHAAARAVARIGATAVLPLLEHMRSEHRSRTVAAIEALGLLGEDARDGVPLLLEELERGEGANLMASIEALGRIGAAAAGAEPRLQILLENPDEDIRGAACAALAGLGAAAAPSRSLLKRIALNDSADFVRQAAVRALGILPEVP